MKILLGVGMNAPYFLVHNIKDYQLKKFAFFMPLEKHTLLEKHVKSDSYVEFQLLDT